MKGFKGKTYTKRGCLTTQGSLEATKMSFEQDGHNEETEQSRKQGEGIKCDGYETVGNTQIQTFACEVQEVNEPNVKAVILRPIGDTLDIIDNFLQGC